MGRLQRYVLAEYARFFGGILAALTAVFLVADFVDRAKNYNGPHWVQDVAVLYGFKTLTTIYQLAPAALLLAAAVTVSSLRKKGELTAIDALCFGPKVVYGPIALFAIAAAAGLVVFGEAVVIHADQRAEEITAEHFHRWGDWRFYHEHKQWFRHGDRLFHLERGDADRGFEDVTVLGLTGDFRLAERIDAARMAWIGGTRWRLSGVSDRLFLPDGGSTVSQAAVREYDLGVAKEALDIQTGRPQQMRIPELTGQIRARKTVGLPFRDFLLALHNKFAYPFAALPAALLAVGLALRPTRRGHLTTAMVEGLAIIVFLWAVMVVGKSLALGARISPAVAAWAPFVLLAIGALALWLRREGYLRRPA